MAEASPPPPPSVRRSEPQKYPRELKDLDTAEAAETLMQINGEKHDDDDNNNKKMMMKREKALEESEKKKKKKKTVEKVADLGKKKTAKRVVKLVADTENDEDEISEESFRLKKQKYRSLRDIYKATEPVSTMKVMDFKNDQHKGDHEVTSTTSEVRKEAKSFGAKKKQKYRSLRDIYKATVPVSSSY